MRNKVNVLIMCMLAVMGLQIDIADGGELSATIQDDMVIVRIDDATFTCYRFGEGQKYPYFYPVNGPLNGLSVTTESSLPYPHHRSLYFGCDRVNGGNYWQEGNDRGQIVSQGPEIVSAGPDRVVIHDTCRWLQPGEAPIIRDSREITVTVPDGNTRLIDFIITLEPLTDITILKTNHSLFSARMTPALSVNSGGVLVNANGGADEKGTAGINSAWCDYSGARFGAIEGLAIFDHPANKWYPNKWFTRDYGFFSPTSLYWIGEEGVTFPAGEPVTFRYRVVVHAGNADDADIAGRYREWTE